MSAGGGVAPRPEQPGEPDERRDDIMDCPGCGSYHFDVTLTRAPDLGEPFIPSYTYQCPESGRRCAVHYVPVEGEGEGEGESEEPWRG